MLDEQLFRLFANRNSCSNYLLQQADYSGIKHENKNDGAKTCVLLTKYQNKKNVADEWHQ